MLKILQYEELDRLLLEATEVLARFSRKQADFIPASLEWMAQIEEALRNNRLSLASSVASTRAELLSDATRTPFSSQRSQRSPRTERTARTVAAVKAVVAELGQELAPCRARFNEAEGLTRQAIAIAAGTGVLPAIDERRHMTASVLLSALQGDRNTAGGAIQLAGLVGTQDALIILSRHHGDI